MKYKFVIIRDKTLPHLKYSWMLECNDVQTLLDHNDKYMHTEIEKGVKDWFSSNGGKTDHLTTNWSSVIYSTMLSNGKNFINTSCELENKIINNKINAVNEYGTIYLRENGSYMLHTSHYEVISFIEKDYLLYPEYSEKDIKISQWINGTHWYAKIGKMDVVSEDGTAKWNTYEEAYKEALKYFNKL
jgi:hypothetical protein